MAVKQGTSPKLKHANQARKASVAKAGRRSGPKPPKRRNDIIRLADTYSYGLTNDQLKSRSTQMLDRLVRTMCSTSPTFSELLRFAMISYVTHYSDINWCRGEHPVQRHKRAVEIACNGWLPPDRHLRNYAERQFESAFRATGSRVAI